MIWAALWVSLRVSLVSTAVISVTGVGLAYLLAKGRFPGRSALEIVASFPIALPPTVLGWYLLVDLSGHGLLGRLMYRVLGHTLNFTFAGIVIAASIESFPYCLRASRAAIEGVDGRLEQAARTMGLAEWRVALQVTLPAARRGIIAGIAMGFGRALGDFGATMMVSGGAPGTVTMPLAIYDAVVNGASAQARDLAALQMALALVILLFVGRLERDGSWFRLTGTALPRRPSRSEGGPSGVSSRPSGGRAVGSAP